ncbi:MAG: MarR family transcriptional regulator [Actinomycetaceae bacterium]|nr:MarR family transcriptional regulator [Actinomycetaceae bacterium]
MTQDDPKEPAVIVDEVDGIIQGWSAERPDLDTSPMQVFSRITRLSRHFDLARRTVFEQHELEPWEFDVLSSLRRAGKPYSLTPGKLMAASLVSSGTMTNRIDRLELKRLVKRSPAPDDRRAVLVTLTREGLGRVDSALETLLNAEAALLRDLNAGDKASLARMLRTLLHPFDAC